MTKRSPFVAFRSERKRSATVSWCIRLAVPLLNGSCSAGTSNATPERIFSRVTWQARGRRSYMSMRRLDQVVRIQELGAPTKEQPLGFWRRVTKELKRKWVDTRFQGYSCIWIRENSHSKTIWGNNQIVTRLNHKGGIGEKGGIRSHLFLRLYQGPMQGRIPIDRRKRWDNQRYG